MPLNLGRNLRDNIIQKSYSIRSWICKISGKLAPASLHLVEQFCLWKVHSLARQLDLLGKSLLLVIHSRLPRPFTPGFSDGCSVLSLPGGGPHPAMGVILCTSLPQSPRVHEALGRHSGDVAGLASYREAGEGLGWLHGSPELSSL